MGKILPFMRPVEDIPRLVQDSSTQKIIEEMVEAQKQHDREVCDDVNQNDVKEIMMKVQLEGYPFEDALYVPVPQKVLIELGWKEHDWLTLDIPMTVQGLHLYKEELVKGK